MAGIGGEKVVFGVVLGVSLWVLKVFSTGGTMLVIVAIEWVLDFNEDDDISDVLDVFNLSLGGSYSVGI